MRIKLYITLLVIAFTTGGLKAQTIYANTIPTKRQETKSLNSLFLINYNMGFANGEIQDFTQTNSFRGTSMEYRAFLSNQVSIGLAADYQNFYDAKGKETMNYQDAELTGNAFNWVYSTTVMATMHYYLKNPAISKITPFVGLGAGGVYTNYEKTLGGVRFQGDEWQFGLAPEAGFLVRLNNHLFFNASARYNYTFESSDMNSQKYWTIKTGFAFAF
ncbi:hypothetical protein K4L44_08940 [Halosquirtibacter laminarini]|uniref:Uncharacterized protein n=1 Tax=Halosquirtibacter laminarini TaxID=3374600 RepID=A0AC61NQS1_9BACT|nr:hypothetical protein K4L44_08940 [Prolixibacteraceae bacterium]